MNQDNEDPSLQEPLLAIHGRVDHPEENLPTPLYDGLDLRKSILIKSLYFLDALGSSTWGRFSAIYYNLHGLHSAQIGWLEGLRTAIPTAVLPLWGIASDHYASRKHVWLGTKTISTLLLLLLALPVVSSSFWMMLVVSILSTLFSSNGSLLDAYTLDLLGTRNKLYYGRYRLYASLSWGLGSIVMGYVTDHYGSFDPNFVLFALLSTAMIGLVATQIPNHDNETDETTQDNPQDSTIGPAEETDRQQQHHQDGWSPPVLPEEAAPNTMLHPPPPPPPPPHTNTTTATTTTTTGQVSDLLELALRPRVAWFLCEAIVMGAAMATVERLLFLYLVNDLQASTALCGWSVGVNVLFELPLFWYATSLMNRLGADGLFLLAMLCFVVRVWGYTWLTPATAEWILALECLHGITFACFWIVTTDTAKVLVHETRNAYWRTAIPTCVQMLYSALGVSIGSIVGGWMMHLYGARSMYRVTAGMVALLWICHAVGSLVSRGRYGMGLLPCDKTTVHPPDTVDEDIDDDDDDDDEEDLQSLS